MTLIDLLSKPWAILPDALREIHRIYEAHARGEKADVPAIEARLGRPLANEQQSYTVREGGVAVLSIDGVIAPKANMFTEISGGTSAQLVVKQLQSIAADSRVKAAVQVIDSPGGSVFGIPEWAQAVRDLAAVKPVVTVSDAQIASAAYWGGSAANRVFLTGVTAQAGSIGVYARMPLSQADATSVEFVRGKYKRSAINGAAPSPEYIAYFENNLDQLYQVFVDAVAQQRGVSADAVLQHMADGRMFTGQAAIDAGLVDGFSTVDAIVQELATNPSAYAKPPKVHALGAVDKQAAPSSAPASPPPSLSTEGNLIMNRDELAAQHPALLQSLLAEGAATERARIQGVEAALIPGHESLIASLKFDGKTSPGDAALAVNAAERSTREKQGAAERAAAPKPVAALPAATVELSAEAKAQAEAARIAGLPVDERCKAMWDANLGNVRADFADLPSLVAYTRATEGGKVRELRRA